METISRAVNLVMYSWNELIVAFLLAAILTWLQNEQNQGTLGQWLNRFLWTVISMLIATIVGMWFFPGPTTFVLEIIQRGGGMAATIIGIGCLGWGIVSVVPGAMMGQNGYGMEEEWLPFLNRILLAVIACIGAWVWWSLITTYFKPLANPRPMENFYNMGAWYHWKDAWLSWLVYWAMTLTNPREWNKRMKQFGLR